jgi:hypothetical protein
MDIETELSLYLSDNWISLNETQKHSAILLMLNMSDIFSEELLQKIAETDPLNLQIAAKDALNTRSERATASSSSGKSISNNYFEMLFTNPAAAIKDMRAYVGEFYSVLRSGNFEQAAQVAREIDSLNDHLDLDPKGRMGFLDHIKELTSYLLKWAVGSFLCWTVIATLIFYFELDLRLFDASSSTIRQFFDLRILSLANIFSFPISLAYFTFQAYMYIVLGLTAGERTKFIKAFLFISPLLGVVYTLSFFSGLAIVNYLHLSPNLAAYFLEKFMFIFIPLLFILIFLLFLGHIVVRFFQDNPRLYYAITGFIVITLGQIAWFFVGKGVASRVHSRMVVSLGLIKPDKETKISISQKDITQKLLQLSRVLMKRLVLCLFFFSLPFVYLAPFALLVLILLLLIPLLTWIRWAYILNQYRERLKKMVNTFTEEMNEAIAQRLQSEERINHG